MNIIEIEKSIIAHLENTSAVSSTWIGVLYAEGGSGVKSRE
jgi:hypothetical protein